MDIKDLASHLGIDEEDIKELVDLFITTTVSDIQKIKKGVLDNKSSDVAAASHSIKGAAGNLGLDEIYTLAKDMEMQAKSGSLDHFESHLRKLENQVNALKPSGIR